MQHQPNICQSVRLISRFLEKPRECHLIPAKRVLMYIKDTIDHSVLMPRQENTSMNALVYGYTDSNFSEDQDDNKSITCYLFMINGATTSWSSRK